MELNELLEGDWGGRSPGIGPGGAAGNEPQGGDGGPVVSISGDHYLDASLKGQRPPRTRGAGAPAWSLLLSQSTWDYFSRLEFYEADATLPARTRLFHHW